MFTDVSANTDRFIYAGDWMTIVAFTDLILCFIEDRSKGTLLIWCKLDLCINRNLEN